jgi:hypothetical protein
MFLIEYNSDGAGCPNGGVYGELRNYSWNSNDFGDTKFPNQNVVLDFYAEHKFLDTDFFYFGSEFICSEIMLNLILSYRYGSIDIIELSLHTKGPSKSTKRYFLLRSKEIRSILDVNQSVYEVRLDPETGSPEIDLYHPGRIIYDSISRFVLNEENIDLDFFICSEMLMHEYVFSTELKTAMEEKGLKGIKFIKIEETNYDARLDF